MYKILLTTGPIYIIYVPIVVSRTYYGTIVQILNFKKIKKNTRSDL